MQNSVVSNTKIVHAAAYIDALKSSGYKSTYNAIAEIVDNSFDAEASNVFIIGEQTVAGNGEKRIVSFGFLDDGKGMDYDTLRNCLTIGYTTNQERKGMGRFGVGLPQASVFVCDRVEVYSWQNGIENCMRVHLDLDDIKEQDLNEIAPPISIAFPEKYKKFLTWRTPEQDFDFRVSGTFVLWTKCTTIDHKKWNTCVTHMSEDLGRKYRYFLENNSKTISMVEMVSSHYQKMYPNDPLYLMNPSQECLPEDVDKFISNNYCSKPYNVSSGYVEPMFELFKSNEEDLGYVDLEIDYEESGVRKKGIARIKYSVVKSKYYSKASLKTDQKPGTLSYGKSSRLINNVGISIVRNQREIDFGSFGFFSIYNSPEFRWWGIEISFGSDLDTAFGISNNKQFVNLKPMSKEEMSEVDKNELKTVWHQLADEIMPTIAAMTQRNSKVRSEEPPISNPTPTESSQIAEEAEKNTGIEAPEEPELTEKEKEEQALVQLVNEGNEEANVSTNQIKQLIDSKVRVVPVYNKGKNDNFIDLSYAAGTLSVILNANHDFYNILVKDIMEKNESKIPFELFVMSVARSIKDLQVQYDDAMEDLVYKINLRITQYMKEYKKQNE